RAAKGRSSPLLTMDWTVSPDCARPAGAPVSASSITATVSSSIVSVIGSVRHGTVTSNVLPIAYVLMFSSFHLTPLLGRYRWVGVGAAYPSRSVYRSPPWPVLVSRDPWRGRFLPARRGLGWREPHGHLVTAYAAVKHWCARGRYPRV